MTQKVFEIGVMVYSMTKNRKIYKQILLVTSFNINKGDIENQQISKITNVEKHRNIRKWRAIYFFIVKCQRISLDFLDINRNKNKI